jgi:hypothetical protein
MNTQNQSRFLKEIPDRLLVCHDIGNLQPYMIKQWIAQWLGINEHRQETPVLTFGNYKQKADVVTPTISSSQTSKHTASSGKTTWRVNQPVAHATFGTGIITQVEERNGSTYTTVKFKIGTKKILSSFLQKI